MTGMDEMADGRPLTLGGWPGKGVSAGDKGKLLYTQHNRRCGERLRGWGVGGQRHFHSKKTTTTTTKQPWLFLHWRSHSAVQIDALMCHYFLSNVPSHPNAKNYFLLIFQLQQCSFVAPIYFDISPSWRAREAGFSSGGVGAILASLSESDN